MNTYLIIFQIKNKKTFLKLKTHAVLSTNFSKLILTLNCYCGLVSS